MKIDVYSHTSKSISGDSHYRSISSELFAEIIKSTDVKIVAVTIYNYFDIEQCGIGK